MKDWPPRGMVARLALVLTAALAIEYAGNTLLHKWQERALISVEKARRVAEHLANADQLAAHVEPADRPRLMADMLIQGMTLNWVPGTIITDSTASHPRLVEMRGRFDEMAPYLAGRDLRFSIIPSDSGQRDLLGALRLADGSFITFRVRPFLDSPPPFAVIMMLHLLLIAAVLGAALLMVRALVRPLINLAEAADATGRGATPDIQVEGPWEVRRVATAFRAMQSRLLQMMEDHTRALVSLSHDLRTPIQRLRLRAALLPDEQARDAMGADLADMEKFIGSVTGFMQSGSVEDDRLVDLAAIVMTIVDNASDMGGAIEYQGPDELPVMLKPLALKRAIGNLVDNALDHADQVRVILKAGDPIVLSVEDDGPGIAENEREEAFLPFRRLKSVRRRSGGGSGLGLAIARSATAAFKAQIRLGESDMGGLAAVIEIPAPVPGPDRERPGSAAPQGAAAG